MTDAQIPANSQGLNVLVTVGMGPWPFDRLLRAVDQLTSRHRVFAQTGSSTLPMSCPHADFVSHTELLARAADADVVITHAGNTVRLIQRMGKLPLAVARTAALGEMADDHQVEFLRDEEARGRVQAVWDVTRLPQALERHRDQQIRDRAGLELAPTADPTQLADRLDTLWQHLAGNPYRRHPLRRYAYAWEELVGVGGRHLDVGCGNATFVAQLARDSARPGTGVDVHAGYLAEARRLNPEVQVAQSASDSVLPFADRSFSSVSLLDVLEHCADEDRLLREIRRVLRPGGLLVLTVPARHAFSFLDPDNAKFRLPRLHRAVYSARFGRAVYHQRFVDTSDGLIGDIAVGQGEHTNYQPDELIGRLTGLGYRVVRRDGANYFWRILHAPALLAGARLRRFIERAILIDGRLFRRANLFLTLEVPNTHPVGGPR